MSGICIPELANSFSGNLIVYGTARCVWDDHQRFDNSYLPIWENWDVMTVNDAVMYMPWEVNHAYSHDNEQLVHWIAGRRRAYQARHDVHIHAHTVTPNKVDSVIEWPFPNTGTSGLGAAYVACALGYSRIVLCGLPLDDSGHFYDPPWVETNFSREENERRWVRAKKEIFQDRVRSMSGRTRDLLGAP